MSLPLGPEAGPPNPSDAIDVSTAYNTLNDDIAKYDSLAIYLHVVEGYYEKTSAFKATKIAALASEPYDRSYGYTDPEFKVATSFWQGILLGLRAVELSQPQAVLDTMTPELVYAMMPKMVPNDEAEFKHVLGTRVQNLGDVGYAMATCFHDKLNEWDMKATRDASLGIYFRRGFGFAVITARNAAAVIRDQEFESLVADLDTSPEFDWTSLEAQFDD